MAYYHMEDDWQDERKVSSLTVKTMLRGKVKKIMEQYTRQSRAIESALNELSVCEREGSTDLDKTAGLKLSFHPANHLPYDNMHQHVHGRTK